MSIKILFCVILVWKFHIDYGCNSLGASVSARGELLIHTSLV